MAFAPSGSRFHTIPAPPSAAIGPTGSRFRSIPGQALGGYRDFATLTTALTGTNNDLKYTAKAFGTGGNAIRVRYVDPSAATQALSVAVSGSDITVNLATDGSSVITSTAAQVAAAIAASTPASALVSTANASGNDGSGVVTALGYTSLAGGSEFTFGRN